MNPGNDAPDPPPEADDWPDFDDPDECPACHGTGWQDCGIVAIECPECGGCG